MRLRLAVGVLLPVAILSACGRSGRPELSSRPLEWRIAQTLVVPLESDSAALEDWTTRLAIGGVLVDSGDAARIARRVARLQSRSTQPLLITARLDRGAGAVAAAATGFPPARAVAALATELSAESGRVVGREARAMGINIALVHGLPTNGSEPVSIVARSPVVVRSGMGDWIGSVRDEGVVPILGLFWNESPGDSVLDWDRARLEAIELAALRSGLEHGAGGVLVGKLVLPSVTGDTIPLPFSPAAIEGLIRNNLGPSDLVVVRVTSTESAVRAMAAGADLLIGVRNPERVIAAIALAVGTGQIPAARVDSAASRVLRLKAAISENPPPLASDTLEPALGEPGALAVARDVFASLTASAPPGIAWPPAPTLQEVDPSTVGMSNDLLAEVDEVIQQAIADSVFPGAALAVGRKSGLVRMRGYGSLSYLPDAPPVNARETIYDLASLSKIIGTTAAVMELVEEGRLQLDAPVRHYIAEFEGEGKAAVTLRHLLTHTSGLPAGIWLYGSARSADEALRQVVNQPLKWEPGERVQYSDLGMILMAEVARRAADMPLDEYLALHVYAPLGMSSTMYLPPIVLQHRIAPSAVNTERPFVLQGIVHDGNAFRLGGIAGHAGIFSTARDMAIFAQTMLNGGPYGHVRLYDSATVARFTRRQPGAEQRALGWDTPSRVSSAGHYFSDQSFGHTGYTGTSLWIDPEKDLFVVFLTNRTYSGASAREIFRVRQAVHDAVAEAIDD
ncbi:MAG TPA: serine hydrolase [Longimicrobiaceae bacterium]|nr:serine hydrolase [Longimicrobiaceae bacterium]